MSCCKSCAHGRKCEGKNPMTRRETASALREARSYAKAARTALGKGRRTYFSGRADGLFEAAVKYGKARRFRHVATTGKTMGRNPNFLYMTNRRRRNPDASTNFIYEANGKKKAKHASARKATSAMRILRRYGDRLDAATVARMMAIIRSWQSGPSDTPKRTVAKNRAPGRKKRRS